VIPTTLIPIRPGFNLHPDELWDHEYDADPDVLRIREEQHPPLGLDDPYEPEEP
jgi:hypothetical protein